MFYVGIESGNDIILKKVTKGATAATIVKSCQKAMRHGFILSCMIIIGLGGRTYTQDHIRDTAKVLNEIAPDYVGALTLQLEEGVYEEFMTKFAEPFVFLEDLEILDELERLVADFNPSETRNIQSKPCIKCLLSCRNHAQR